MSILEQKNRCGTGVILALSLLIAFSCAKAPPEIKPNQFASTSREQFWIPEDSYRLSNPSPAELSGGIPPDLQPEAERMTLGYLVDVALRNNPETGQAWEVARATAAAWGVARGEYYPNIDGSGGGGWRENTQSFNNITMTSRGGMGQIGASLDYLLFDFGGRSGRVGAAKQALIAANWNHNQVIQDVLRDVPKAYYIHISDKAQVIAAEENLTDAQVTLAATRLRRKAGVSTIADVLQAQANEAQVRVNLIGDQGRVEISRGMLATTVGWPANTYFNIVDDFEHVPTGRVEQGVDNLVDLARHNRPDLNSAVATLRKKEAELKEARAGHFPKIKAGGNVDFERIKSSDGHTYYAGAMVSLPIFEGFKIQNNIKRASAEVEAARSALKVQEEGVINEVWSGYYNFRTAARQIDASNDLLRSSQESFNVSLGRYKAGVADIIELLNAQSTLADARAQLVDAKTNLFTSYAELLHAIGSAIPAAYGAEKEWPDTNSSPDDIKSSP